MSTAAWALLVSLLALVLTGANTVWARRRDKREMFLRMHDRLLDPEVVAGRRMLYTINSREYASHLSGEDQEALTRIYRALALYDVLGLYVERKWIDKQTVLDEWGESLSKSLTPGRFFIRGVRSGDNARVKNWPHWQKLAEEADAHIKAHR